jgi:putative transposase
MSHSCSRNTIHLVLSTNDRAKTITPQLQPKLCAFIVGICKNENIYVLAIGGAQDHIHILLQLPPIVSLAKLTPHQIKIPLVGCARQCEPSLGNTATLHSA